MPYRNEPHNTMPAQPNLTMTDSAALYRTEPDRTEPCLACRSKPFHNARYPNTPRQACHALTNHTLTNHYRPNIAIPSLP